MNIVRHANRRPPAAKIVCKPDAVRWQDTDRVSISIPRSQLQRIHAWVVTEEAHRPDLYPLRYDLECALFGGPLDTPPAGVTLDHDAWERYEQEERGAA